MDDFLYDNRDMTGKHIAKIALVDSGNTSIQIPSTIFQNTMKEMQKHEPSIYQREVDGNEIMVSRSPCHELEKKLKNIEFML